MARVDADENEPENILPICRPDRAYHSSCAVIAKGARLGNALETLGECTIFDFQQSNPPFPDDLIEE
jgi:hypothetical protein